MPPSSRKRNKGKDRKAKQLAKKEENQRADSHDFWCSSYGSNQCDHGRALMSFDNHPVFDFMDQFFFNLHHNNGMQVIENLKDALEKHPQIWNNENYRNTAINIFIRIGSNLLLHYDVYFNPICIARSILVLEQYNGTDGIDSVLCSSRVLISSRDLNSGADSIRRDLLKFYRKRTSCKCLKKMHLEARTSTPKMGKCMNCSEQKERVALSVCSECMVTQYCSRKCQVADWPEHKRECNIVVSARKREKDNRNIDR